MALDTAAMLAAAEHAATEVPGSLSLLSAIRSLEKRQHDLAHSFAEETNRLGIDTCSYRFFGGESQPPIMALSRVLELFQVLLTAVHGSVENGQPGSRGRSEAEILEETTLHFGYTFPGSVGFMLTLPRPRPCPLAGEATLDESIDMLFALARATSPSEIAAFARQLGPDPIRAAHLWASAHVEAGFGAAIDWRRKTNEVHLVLQQREMERLVSAIAESQAIEDQAVVAGSRAKS